MSSECAAAPADSNSFSAIVCINDLCFILEKVHKTNLKEWES